MAASVYTGTGNFTYSNSTGGNVRIIVMSCKTESNTTQNGTITCGSATYPLYPNITWGKGILVPDGNAVLQPVEYVISNGSSFSLAGAPTGTPTGQELITNTNTSDLNSTWTVPSNVTSVCVVVIGSGGKFIPTKTVDGKEKVDGAKLLANLSFFLPNFITLKIAST